MDSHLLKLICLLQPLNRNQYQAPLKVWCTAQGDQWTIGWQVDDFGFQRQQFILIRINKATILGVFAFALHRAIASITTQGLIGIPSTSNYAVMICIQGGTHPSFTMCGAKLGPKPSQHSKAIVDEPQAPGAILNQQNMKGYSCSGTPGKNYRWFFFFFFFLRRRKKDARESTTFVALEGGCLCIILRACLSHLGTGWRGKNNLEEQPKY